MFWANLKHDLKSPILLSLHLQRYKEFEMSYMRRPKSKSFREQAERLFLRLVSHSCWFTSGVVRIIFPVFHAERQLDIGYRIPIPRHLPLKTVVGVATKLSSDADVSIVASGENRYSLSVIYHLESTKLRDGKEKIVLADSLRRQVKELFGLNSIITPARSSWIANRLLN